MKDWRTRVLAALRALIWIGLATVVVPAVLSFNPLAADPDSPRTQFTDEVLIAATTLGLGWAFLRLEGRPLRSLGLDVDRRWLRQFAAGALLGGGIILAAALVAALLGGVRWRPGSPGLSTLLGGGGFYLAVAWAEELHFRGYAFQRSCQAVGPWIAQAAFAAYFIHSHWQNPGMAGTVRLWAALNIGLASLLLGHAWVRTGSLALSLGIHLGWNFMQGPLLGFGVSGTHGSSVLEPVLPPAGTWLHGGPFGLEAGLPCAVACLLALLLLERLLRSGAILDGRGGPCRDGS